ncbi:MAG: hypothetical protein EYC69_01330 [Bacteroidetes bacterium]|nr:MAG: hypothetical protein EYC69_01330 [Bacteroidota bacterium]
MIQLADEVFATRTDPDQLDVTEEVMEKLEMIHPHSLSSHIEGDGPVVWILLIPTTNEIMQGFLKKEISEKELFNLTPVGQNYEAVYLCSALVLPEFRKKGLAFKTALNALKIMMRDHRIKNLYAWPFSKEGIDLAKRISLELGIPVDFRV